MKTKLYLSVLAICIIAISSCKKFDGGNNVKPSTLGHGGGPDTDVYVSGYVYDVNNRIQIASVWKNGVLTKLSDSTGNAYCESVAVHDSDVLVAATFDHPDFSGSDAYYFRNGHKVLLANNAIVGQTHSAAFSDCGCDAYICGAIKVNGKYKAVYWKNDIAHLLPGTSPQTFAVGIRVHNGNVYVAGIGITPQNTTYAIYWKNDTAFKLTDTLANSKANDIALIGNDVYVVGFTSTTNEGFATYWKNGTPTVFSGASNLQSIATKGSNYYITGSDSDTQDQSMYWINGMLNHLPEPANTRSIGDAITVLGSDIYISGTRVSAVDNLLKPGYWKNGNFVQLLAHQGYGLSIAAIAH